MMQCIQLSGTKCLDFKASDKENHISNTPLQSDTAYIIFGLVSDYM